MAFFRYEQAQIDYLKRKDKKLGAAIERIGPIERAVTSDPFEALVESVVAQQISSKAADTVWKRLLALLVDVTPKSIVETDVALIQQCGLSMRKALYIKGIGEAACSGTVDFTAFDSMPDEQIIKQLTFLHGIGVWTAEMLLIFSLNRPNVVSWGDLAIRRGMMNLYGLNELTKEQFERYRKRYAPYGSVASLYLWALSTES